MHEILASHKSGYVEVTANEDGQRVGRAISINLGRTALLEEFYVSRFYRKHGVGSEIMERVEELAAQEGATRMLRVGLFCDAPSIAEYIQITSFLVNRGFRYFGVVLSKNLSRDS